MWDRAYGNNLYVLFFCLFWKSDSKTIDILLLVEADGYKKLLITMSAKTDSCENLLWANSKIWYFVILRVWGIVISIKFVREL